MSRAFIKEDAGDDELPERPQSRSPNYVTPYGLDRLRKEAAGLSAKLAALPADGKEAKAVKRDLRYYEGRIASALVVDTKDRPGDEVRFGATVVFEGPKDGPRTVTIVGQDEAAEGGGKIAWDSALALAMMGAKPGGSIEFEEGGRVVRLEVREVRYGAG